MYKVIPRRMTFKKWTFLVCSFYLFWRSGSSSDLEPCPNSRWKLRNTTCFLYVNIPKTWPEAQKYCWNHGASLPIFADTAFPVIPFNVEINMTNQWSGLYVFGGKLWWDCSLPLPAKPKELRYKWSEKSSNLTDGNYAVISHFSVNKSIEFFHIKLKILSGSESRTFTCLRPEQPFRHLREDPKCLSPWISTEEIDYCVTMLPLRFDNFADAQHYCRSLNSSLWAPTKEFDFDYMRNFMSQTKILEMHMDKPERVLDLPSWNFINSRHCHYVNRTNLVPGQCLTKRQYFCRQRLEEFGLDVDLRLKHIPEKAIQLSKGTYLINSTCVDSIILECSSLSTNKFWIKDEDYRTEFTYGSYETLVPIEKSLDKIVPRVEFSSLLVQGIYTCAAKSFEHGWQTSKKTLTFMLNDVFVTWVYVEIEFEMDIDLTSFFLSDDDKVDLWRAAMPEAVCILIDKEDTYIYPAEIVSSIANRVQLKFGLYASLANKSISRLSLMTQRKKATMDYLISYLTDAEEVMKTFLEEEKIVEFLNRFNSLTILSKKKRSARYGVTAAGTKEKERLILKDTWICHPGSGSSDPSKRYGVKKAGAKQIEHLYLKNTWICQPKSVKSDKGSFRFEAGLPGEYANSTSVCPDWDLTPLAFAFCNGSLKDGYSWEIVRIYDCIPKPNDKSEVTDKLLNILENMTLASESDIINDVEQISANNHTKFTFMDVRIVAEIVISASRSFGSLDGEKGQTLANIVSNTMLAPLDKALNSTSYQENIAKSKFKLIKSLESVVDKVKMSDSKVTWPTEQFVVRINEGTNKSYSFGLVSTGINKSDVYVEDEDLIERADIVAGISIPISAYKSQAERKDSDKIKTSFIIYKQSKMFSNPDCQDDDGSLLKITSFVISGTVQDFQIANLSEGIKLKFKIDKNTKSPTCAFISEDDDGVTWHWSKEGIILEHFDNTTGMLECSSNHLTNFAVLAGFCKDPNTLIAKVLTYISIIGMVLSIICLSLVILCQMFFKKFRKGQIQIALLNLSIALIVVNLLVLLGLDMTRNRTNCIIVAALLHYFLLVSFAWMFIEAILQYYKFVKVFNVHVSSFVWKTVLPAWILPALIVGVTAAVDYNLFRGPKYYCWLAKGAFYYAFLLPLGLIITANTFIFIRIIKGISCDRPKGMQTNQTKSRLVWLQVQVAICCFIVMGLTWAFSLFAIGRVALVMQFLFAIFNSLQGFFIFVLFNLREKPVRKAWYDLLCMRKTGKKVVSSGTSSEFPPKNRNKKDTKGDINFKGSDACIFKNTNYTDATLSD